MESDLKKTGADKKFRHVGTGENIQFACFACKQPKRTFGRKQRPFRGAKVWVCADCVIKEQHERRSSEVGEPAA